MTAEHSPAEPDGLAWATERGMGALAEKMGIEFTEFTVERAVATMPVEGNTQPVGLMHGGAYVVLGESLGSMAANLHAGPHRLAVGPVGRTLGETPQPDLGPLQIGQHSDGPPGGVGRRAHPLVSRLVIVVVAVAEVHPGYVHPGLD